MVYVRISIYRNISINRIPGVYGRFDSRFDSNEKIRFAGPYFEFNLYIFTRDSIYAIARICYRLSVRPSVTRVDHTKTVEVRIMKFLPYGSPMPLVFVR